MWGIIFQVRKGKKLILELSDELGWFVAYSVIFIMFLGLKIQFKMNIIMYFVMKTEFQGVSVFY